MGVTLNPATLLNGGGMDVSSVVSQIEAQQQGQVTIWQNEQTDLSTDDGVLLGLNQNLSTLQTDIQALANPNGPLAALAANSSDSSILTADAQVGATSGTYQIVVNNLASAGQIYTAELPSATASFLPSGATGGDIQLQVGGSNGTVHDIPITPGSNDTLNTLASYINQQSSQNNWGVTASVVTDANGSRLAIYSQATGTAGALAITANTTTGTLYTADLASADTSILPNGQQSGDIQLQVGGANGTIDDIPITAGSNDTLNTLAAYINQQSSQNNWGVTANVVQDSGGYHLAISTQAQGPAGALAFTNNTTILTTVPNPATNLAFQTPTGGTDADITIDGMDYQSQDNTISNAIPGVTLNLASADPNTTVQLTVGPDASQATQAINTFVTDYNAIISNINQQYTIDPTTNAEGPLASDSSLRSLQSSLLNDASYAVSGNSGGLVNLASLGINMNNDGTLTVGTAPNGQSLSQIIASNPAAVQSFFQNASNGFATNFNSDMTNLTDPTTGVLNADIAENQTDQQDLTNQITNFQNQLLAQQQELTQELDQVNATLEEYPFLVAEINAELGNTTSSTSNSSNTSGTSGTSNG
jgi:flagellar hook-associated protein 2